MAWTFEEKFDDIANGHLYNDSVWSRIGTGQSNEIEVQDSVSFLGDKSAYFSSNALNSVEASISPSSGVMYYAVRATSLGSSGDGLTLALRVGTSDYCTVIKWNDNSGAKEVEYYDQTGYHAWFTVSADIWYIFEVSFDAVDNSLDLRYKESGGAWSTKIETTSNDPFSTLSKLTLAGDPGGWVGYIDEISATDPDRYDLNWSSEEMTIDNTKVSGSADLTDFPVLIKDGNLADEVYAGVNLEEILFEEDFEAYSVGDLNGQGSWTATADIDVQTGTVQEGSKALSDNSSGDDAAVKTLTAITEDYNDGVTLTYYARAEYTTGATSYPEVGVFLYNGANRVTLNKFSFKNETYAVYNAGTGYVDVGPTLYPNVWYKASVQWDFANNKIRGRVDDGTWSAWLNSENSFSQVDSIKIQMSNSHTNGKVFLDNVKIVKEGKPQDLRFSTDSEGAEKLNCEIVSFDADAKECEIWLKVPTVGYNADTPIYAWYGNTSATLPDADNADEGSEGVWNSNYKAVWHMQEESGVRYDSTSNDNDLQDNNTVGYAAGQIGNGANFERDNAEFLSITDANQTGLDLSGDFIYSGWHKFEGYETGPLFMKYDISPNRGYYAEVKNNGSNITLIEFSVSSDGTTWTGGNLDWEASLDTWYYITIVYDASAGGAKLYVDSSLQDSITGLATSIHNNSQIFTLGATRAPTGFHDGIMDDVRIATFDATAGWIATEYNNQDSPSTFWKSATPPAASVAALAFGAAF